MVSSVTYNSANQPLVITLGLGDTATYTYDPNTGRMTSYTFSVGATPVTDTGYLSWNQNGTLLSLSIVDGFNASGTQYCTYGNSDPLTVGYDELGRLLSVQCENVYDINLWGRTFSYDQYNNLTKTVPPGDTGISFAPGYSSANNRFQNGSTYDSNGNLLTDTFNAYTWNQDNHVLTLNAGVKNYYDASGNLVDYLGCQHLLSPVGSIASMCGQSINQVRVPLPGGVTQLNYGSSVLFTHKDWLGSDRLISNRSTRTYYSDEAFAPFGEEYAAFGISNWPMNFTGDYSDLDSSGTKSILDTPNRELSPTQGRWISPDPAHASWNGYSYSTNPLGETDPTGLDSIRIPWNIAPPSGGAGGNNPASQSNLAGLLDPGAAFMNDAMQQFYQQAGLNSPMQQGLASYEWSIGATGNWVSGPAGPGGFGCDGPSCWYPPLSSGNSSSWSLFGWDANAANNCTPLTTGCFNVPTQQQLVLAECTSSFRNSATGKVIQFGSLLSFADNFWGTATTWGETIATKGAYFKVMELAGQSVTPAGEVTYITTAVNPAVGAAGTLGIGLATVMDYAARTNCQALAQGVDPTVTD